MTAHTLLAPLRNASLRAYLLGLNAVVVVALLLLSTEAWLASSLQDKAHQQQVQLSSALQLTKQADMLHDAIHSEVLAALLVGQVQGLSLGEVQRHLHDNVNALNAVMLNLSRAPGLQSELSAVVVGNMKSTQAYGMAGLQLVQQVAEQRALAMAALPEFRVKFEALKKDLDEQSTLAESAMQAARRTAAEDAVEQRQTLLLACFLTVVLTSAVVAAVTQLIRRRVTQLGNVAQTMADGDLSRRAATCTQDELGELGGNIDRMATNLSRLMESMRGEAHRATFDKQLTEALDMADRERQVAEVSSRAMEVISAQHPMELLLSDSSQAQMERAAEHPQAGAPGCGVGSPYDCVAVRRGSIVSFEHSDSLNACENLRGRACGAVAAVCVPVTFMGRAIGVLHAAGPTQSPLSNEQAHQLGTLAAQIGMRVGTVRAFEKTQIQAATDSLTGLPNRRTLEQRLHTLSLSGEEFAVVMCDLDRFKLLNDTHGHAAGDTALRLFADVLRQAKRESDNLGRWGGEEFAFVLAATHAKAAEELVNRIRKQLVTALQVGKSAPFTASFGIADSTMSRRPDQLIQLADMALYEAKATGRDRACIAPGGVEPEAPQVKHAEPQGAGIAHADHEQQLEMTS